MRQLHNIMRRYLFKLSSFRKNHPKKLEVSNYSIELLINK